MANKHYKNDKTGIKKKCIDNSSHAVTTHRAEWPWHMRITCWDKAVPKVGYMVL